MSDSRAYLEYLKLRYKIRCANYEYYQLGDSSLPDYVWDELFDELVKIEQEHPEWIDGFSPSQTVGWDPADDDPRQ